MSIIVFLIILSVLVLAHEFGHFLVAKRAGARVDEFGLGFPPRLFSWRRGETLYSINLLLFGGFVKILGENPHLGVELLSEDEKSKSLNLKPAHIQASVLVAGVFFNLLLAWVLLSISLMIGLPYNPEKSLGAEYIRDPVIVIVEILPDTPAEKAGLRTGDHLLGFESVKEVQNFTAVNKGQEVKIIYEREGEKFTTNITPPLGVSLDFLGAAHLPIHLAILEGIRFTSIKTWDIIRSVGMLIGGIFTGASSLQMLTGPVGIVDVVGQAMNLGFSYLLFFMAFISINLAVLNLLPIPALDGGRLLFLLIEKLKGSPMRPRVASVANLIGFALLIFLMIAVTINDLIKLF
ncbi:RIP metalloprotease RseP [Candidatus Nomurabacteria bacterium RIFCSPLOWO2_02_FULL_42_17]|uniref:Zinc metalloprotease n=2 Tax=Candidatus Nomuraibacteriota TaxID=1752729 RepID=A0A1F6WJW9_9BACT|nr:MAG: Site-2 protease [Parcubacteria group bacterium GW2011_GWA2_42_18]OGI82178.1 MAG: RIP metalloprotease RseP [Candidatus Nomurabacteria bacterium RIFCSPHIGHO2_02_FULL_42_24]OGI97166.1 MAG: RIP metalloprotease RseP [Candidatus Nomurabacteria bacterium RIFCSPLOWO2_02_FULL_42_17]